MQNASARQAAMMPIANARRVYQKCLAGQVFQAEDARATTSSCKGGDVLHTAALIVLWSPSRAKAYSLQAKCCRQRGSVLVRSGALALTLRKEHRNHCTHACKCLLYPGFLMIAYATCLCGSHSSHFRNQVAAAAAAAAIAPTLALGQGMRKRPECQGQCRRLERQSACV